MLAHDAHKINYSCVCCICSTCSLKPRINHPGDRQRRFCIIFPASAPEQTISLNIFSRPSKTKGPRPSNLYLFIFTPVVLLPALDLVKEPERKR